MGPFSSITSLLIWTATLLACGCLWIFCSSLLAFQLGKHRPGKGRRLVQVLEGEAKQKNAPDLPGPLAPSYLWVACRNDQHRALARDSHSQEREERRGIYPTVLRLKGAPQLARKLLPLTLPLPPPPLSPSKTRRAAALLLS